MAPAADRLTRFADLVGSLIPDALSTSIALLVLVAASSQEEQRTLRAHPAAGADIVARVRALRRAAEIVRSHHERPDGLGYAFGLKSGDVPNGARILNVSDAFDAMTSDWPYRRALTYEQTRQELIDFAGAQFDPLVVEAFLCIPPHEWREIREETRPQVQAHTNGRTFQSVGAL